MNGTLILTGKVLGTAALATGAIVTGVTGVHSAGASSAATTKTAHCGHGFALAKAPASLKTDLKAARQQPKGKERREALTKVRKEARQGHYGQATEIAVLKRENRRLHWRAQAPDALKAALKDAAQQPAGEQRKAAVAKVMSDAASGTYGEKVEKIAKKRAQRQDACQAKRQERQEKKKS
ncbi:hypothetical protein D9V37_02730 [Nocardioides mangrovicus]|uniref:Uncharacterized protein n=1 Tax=Nocardioides mangrovicus TaxID=2478913 RepID=A0A3L8P658_9ACTN|nr:hypothetical protein [Nocardioides mangrovicus]RLV50880.1 hypothetical protein D9V37_02730 [Nocardioides mangrovicus]